METLNSIIFQSDSEIVIETFKNNLNYLIEFNKNVKKEYCVIYFSSNDLYFPNSYNAFKETIINKNRYEWYGNRINYAHKHIFIRDIQKQWYLGGINHQINTPQKLTEFLKKESEGYKLIFVGSSAGGFASVIFGQLLNAEKILTFNGQFEINSILTSSDEKKDPIIFRSQNNSQIKPFYDSRNFIVNPTSIYYFHSLNSKWDIEQNKYVKDIELNRISFHTSNHGIPILRSNLNHIINLSDDELKKYVGHVFHPLLFSLQKVGLLLTIKSIFPILRFFLKKVYIYFIHKNTDHK